MIIDYEDDGVIRWERNGEKKHAELIELIEAYEDKRKHGRWIFTQDETWYAEYQCSECKEGVCDKTNYCSNCGAKMDLTE